MVQPVRRADESHPVRQRRSMGDSRRGGRVTVAFAAVALCVAAACSAGGDATAKRKTSGTTTTSTPSSTTTLGRPSDQQVLAAVVLAPHDLAAGDTVETVTDGDVVTDNVSLDLCNAAFPSEARRRARHQVEAVAGAPS